MSIINLLNLNKFNKKKSSKILFGFNKILSKYSATDRIRWALKNLLPNFAITSSFGIYSSVILHMITNQLPNIPIILIDTGYLFPETYQFIDLLKIRLNLNLYVFRSNISSSWQESRYGKLWKKGIEGIELYNNINKVQPMKYAIKKCFINTWFAGLRFNQSKIRSSFSYLSIKNNIFKILPILDWNEKNLNEYLKKNDLPQHPLFKKKYISLGDVHTTKKYKLGMSKRDTRFFGLKRECGLHDKII